MKEPHIHQLLTNDEADKLCIYYRRKGYNYGEVTEYQSSVFRRHRVSAGSQISETNTTGND